MDELPRPPDPPRKTAPSALDRVAEDGSLTVLSRRTERQKKRQQKKRNRPSTTSAGLLDLPYEILTDILSRVFPSDLFRLARASRSLHAFILDDEDELARRILRRRYACLEKCLRLPVLLADVDASLHAPLQDAERQEILAIHKKPYQHVRSPDPALVCTCLTCILRWNSLCLAVDFAHWQDHLDGGQPIPIIARGKNPVWNRTLLARHAEVVSRALRRPLWYAVVLEAHLKSTVRSIRRHGANKGNKRRRFRMTPEDERDGTDDFLERSGPPTLDFPFQRDNYYMLEAYLPNRGWNGEEERWMYMPADQHVRDLVFVKNWALRRAAMIGEGDEVRR